MYEIRNYHPSDLTALYRICLKTGNSGKDATDLHSDPEIIGHFYAAPYAVFEPELSFIAAIDNAPYGYIIGTKDSTAFRDKCEEEWFPVLRERYKMPAAEDTSHDAKIIRLIHAGLIVKDEVKDYPAHLHIDILPELQGQGIGRKLMDTFIAKLKELNVPAMHLEVGKSNLNAIQFYEKMGFHIIHEYEQSIAFGMKFED
ncbi:MAG: GNAT family N-acetyltransferase [Bacteroidetes bacterium]|nr:GNAT family N-acetyltransferase [Bacteroidota bacterium]